MGEANWGPVLDDGTHAVTLWLEAALGVESPQFSPNAVGVGRVGSIRVEADVVWTDITDRLTSLTVSGRFARSTQNFSGWSLNATLRNDDGALSRHNSRSPYWLPGIGSTIRAGAPVRCVARWANGRTVREWVLFEGSLGSWKPSYAAGGFDPTVEMEAADAFSRLARFDGFEQTPQGSGETTGERIGRILDNAGHTGPRSIAAGKHTVQATTLAQNALTEAKLTADSEGGRLYSLPDGRIVFEDQQSLMTLDRSIVVQATFADDGRPGALRYLAGVQPAYDDELVVTDVSFARVGGTAQTVSSTRARALQRRIVRETRTDLVCETDEQAEFLAKRTLALRKEARDRIDGLTFSPDAQMVDGVCDPELQAAAWDAVSGSLGLLALVETVYSPIAGEESLLTEDGDPLLTETGDQLTVDVDVDQFHALQHVQGITHRITPTEWVTSLSFSAADVWVAASQSRVGVGRVGQIVVWT